MVKVIWNFCKIYIFWQYYYVSLWKRMIKVKFIYRDIDYFFIYIFKRRACKRMIPLICICILSLERLHLSRRRRTAGQTPFIFVIHLVYHQVLPRFKDGIIVLKVKVIFVYFRLVAWKIVFYHIKDELLDLHVLFVFGIHLVHHQTLPKFKNEVVKG